MIKTIKITNHLDESIDLELRFPEKSGFLVRSVEGLGPSKATINTTDISTGDGTLYNSARVNSRNILFLLDFLNNPTVEDTRQDSYKYFPLKKRVEMQIETANRLCKTYGYVESNEPNIFSSSEGTSISIICPDPYFYAVEKIVTVFSGVEQLFEFPFSNESLTEKLLKFGEISINTDRSITYEGDAPVGILILIHALGPVHNLRIVNSTTQESLIIDSDRLFTLTGSDIIAGDDILISTVKGDKYVILQREGSVYNILNVLDKNPDWFQLEKGENLFSYIAESGITYLTFRVEYQVAYEGI